MDKKQQNMPFHERQPLKPTLWLFKTNSLDPKILQNIEVQNNRYPRK